MAIFTKFVVRIFLTALCFSVLYGNLYAQDYVFEQLDGPDGLAVMEAEHYSNLVLQSESYWELVFTPDFFSGEGAMQALPEDAVYAGGNDSGQPLALSNSAILEYTIDFARADTVYIWLRGNRIDGGTDSFHAGLDGAIQNTSERIAFRGGEPTEWFWVSSTLESETDRPRMYIDSPGTHIFQAFIREGGMKADKIVLTTNPDYIPDIFSGFPEGPPETLVTSVESSDLTIESFQLEQNYPNPFNPSTNISYTLEKNSLVTLKIYNVTGHEIATLVDDVRSAGSHQVTWNALDENNTQLASGIYFARLKAGAQTKAIRMLLMR